MPSATSKSRQTPRRDYRMLSVEDLSGGLDMRKAPTLLKSNRAAVLRNWSLREPGALSVGFGYEAFSTTSLGAGRPQGGQRIYLGGVTPFTLVAWDGGIYKPADTGVWGSPIESGWSDTTNIYFPYDRDMVAIFDSVNIPRKSVDGTTWTFMGIDAPSGTPTAANLAGGTLVNGSTYEFSYSGRDDGLLHEGNESTRVTHTPAGANLSVRLTLPFHADTQVDTLVVYGRDTTAGELVRRRIGTVANPGSGNATFDVTANAWNAGTEAPSDHDVPEIMSFGVVWKNRWWARDAAMENRLRFTQIFEAQSWPSTFYIDIPFERGDDITALIPLGDTLLVFGQSKVFLVIGQTSLDFEIRPSAASQAGALGPAAVDALEEGVIHASGEGIYLFDGATDRLLSYDIDGFAPTAIGWRRYVTNGSTADLFATPLIYHQAAKEVGIGVTSLYPFGDAGEWILDLNRTRLQEVPAWTSTSRGIGGYIHWDGNEPVTGNRGRLFSWSLTTGQLYEERVGTTADGANLLANYTGPTFTNDGNMARVIDGSVEYEPRSGSFGFELLVDGRSLGSQDVNVSGATSTYGTAVYGTATYGGAGRKRAPLIFPLGTEGLTFSLNATYSGVEAFRWYAYRLGIVPEPQHRGF